MISISKITQATQNGSLIIWESKKSKIRDAAARVSRTATLDGGAVIEHLGFSDGDRSFEISAKLSQSQSEVLWSIFTNQTFLNISTEDGFFYGSIERCKVDNGIAKLTFLVKE